MYNNSSKKIGKFSSDDIFLFKLIGGCFFVAALCWIGLF